MNTGSAVELCTETAAATQALGQHLGERCQGGELLVLAGELGAGKTVFARGLAAGLGADPGSVRSPSYTLLHRYPGRLTLNHFDVYFTQSTADLDRNELRDCLARGEVAAVEWGEKFAADFPADRLLVEIEHHDPTRRVLRLRASGPISQRLLEAWS